MHYIVLDQDGIPLGDIEASTLAEADKLARADWPQEYLTLKEA